MAQFASYDWKNGDVFGVVDEEVRYTPEGIR